MEVVARENFKRSTFGIARILACAIGREKKIAVSESYEIAWVAYIGQITNIDSGLTRKL